jgi:hypothetical protein
MKIEDPGTGPSEAFEELVNERVEMMTRLAAEKSQFFRISHGGQRVRERFKGIIPGNGLEGTGTTPSLLVEGVLDSIRVVENLKARLSAGANLPPVQRVCRIPFDLARSSINHANNDPASSRALAAGSCVPGRSSGKSLLRWLNIWFERDLTNEGAETSRDTAASKNGEKVSARELCFQHR